MTILRISSVLAIGLALSACSGGSDHASTSGDGSHASSSAGLPKGDISRGEQLANDATASASGQSCISCHGQDGNAPIDPSYPKLGGQYHDYLAHALQNYRAGKREHALMTPQAAHLSDRQIADLSVYFASRPSQLDDLSTY
ncbi:MAG: cytochrome c [Pseudomonadota bacterium]|nr:cytochrome c [Pseudomonadota bacterium]